MRRSGLGPCLLSALVLVIWAFNATADENKFDYGRSASVIRGERIECPLKQKADEPLDPPSTSAISRAEPFVARDHFKEDITPEAQVRISWLGATFVQRFAVKVESAGGTSLQIFTLKNPSNYPEIIGQLGLHVETRLADLWCLLKLQAGGESGALQINSAPNIFLVRDGMGDLGVVDALWGGAGWEIGASPVGDQRTWPRGTRIFSR